MADAPAVEKFNTEEMITRMKQILILGGLVC